jgi:hypothetical protein
MEAWPTRDAYEAEKLRPDYDDSGFPNVATPEPMPAPKVEFKGFCYGIGAVGGLALATDAEYASIAGGLTAELSYNAWIDTEVVRVCMEVKFAALQAQQAQLVLLERDTVAAIMTNYFIATHTAFDNDVEPTGDLAAYTTQ